MEFGGRYRLEAPRDAVWAALNDAEILCACIPGCKRLVWAGPGRLELEIEVNLGLMKPVFKGELELHDVDPARTYTLLGRGKGGMLGLAQASADIALMDAPGGTELSFAATGGASGQIMKLGKAMIGDRAQRIIDGFFERFAKAMGVAIVPLGVPGDTPGEGR